MRLDKLLSVTATATRTEAAKAARAGAILVNGRPVKKADVQVDPEQDEVIYCGKPVYYKQFRYVLLNKPDGYVSATEDGRDPTVLTLLPEDLGRIGLFPCGRLDKYTLGLMLLTNDGDLSHRLLSPRHHVEKRYAYTCRLPLLAEDMEQLERGVELEDGYMTKPARIIAEPESRSGIIVLTEGKYHQIKRMFEAVGNKIETLERVTFGPLSLDPTLERGEWRYLTDAEIALLQSGTKGVDEA